VKLGGRRKGNGKVSRYQALGVAAAKAKADARLRDVADDLRTLQGEGLSLNAIARRLNDQGIRTTSGSGQWTATAVRRAVLRLAA
jgi:predicted flap endonuclease-1-like 5' DNA nuclease